MFEMFKDGDSSISGEDTVAVDPVTSNDGEQRRAKNAEASVPKKVKEENVKIKSIPLKVSYGVVVAWVGSPPDLSQLNNPGNDFESYDQGFKLVLESIYSGLFQSEGGGKEEEEKIGDLSWFVVSGSTTVDNSGKVGL